MVWGCMQVGRAAIECVSGCACEPSEVDALKNGTQTSQTYFHTLHASPHRHCQIKVRHILPHATRLAASTLPDQGEAHTSTRYAPRRINTARSR